MEEKNIKFPKMKPKEIVEMGIVLITLSNTQKERLKN